MKMAGITFRLQKQQNHGWINLPLTAVLQLIISKTPKQSMKPFKTISGFYPIGLSSLYLERRIDADLSEIHEQRQRRMGWLASCYSAW